MAPLVLHAQVAGAVDVAPAYLMEEIEVSGFQFQPPGETVLGAGDALVALGRHAIERVAGLFQPVA